MFRNYLVVAWRNLMRHKVYSAINIAGLAIGMACCLLILLFVQDALSYDRFHRNAGLIYRVAVERDLRNQVVNSASSPASIGPALAEAYPEVVQVTRIMRESGGMGFSYQDKQFRETGILRVDPNFLEFFDFPLLRGDPQTTLHGPSSIVITEKLARKYFGDESPMGKELTQVRTAYTVTGVAKDPPHNSHIQFDALVPTWLKPAPEEADHRLDLYTYVQLGRNTHADELEQKLPDFVRSYAGAQLLRSESGQAGHFRPYLQPLTGIHLHSHLVNELEPNEDARRIYLFAGMAGLILFVACANYVNLATAQSAHRAREVGMRKVMGAPRARLIWQFAGETLVLSLLALVLAVLLAELILPAYSRFLGREMPLDFAANRLLLPGLLGVALLVGALAGIYPAFVLSAFQPVEVLKGNARRKGRGSLLLRRPLVVAQFAISIGLIVATSIMYRQTAYVTNKNLGFHGEQVVVVPLSNNAAAWVWRSADSNLKKDLLQTPGIVAVSGCSRVPGGPPSGRTGKEQGFIPEDRPGAQPVSVPTLFVDGDFIRVLGIELRDGHNFPADAEANGRSAFIVNEKAAAVLGWSSPLGKRMSTQARPNLPAMEGEVVGLVENFHLESLYHEIEPLVLCLNAYGQSSYNSSSFSVRTVEYILVKVRPEGVQETLRLMEQEWREWKTPFPFEYYFLDQDVGRAYSQANRQMQVVCVLSILTIGIACLGLFGMAAYTVEQRTKEIGTRKVLGASVPSIVGLLSMEFTYLVVAANLVAWPLAYLAMHRWLEGFAYRIALGPGVFVLGGLLALGIAWLTVSWQAIRAALANPVEALRYE